MDDDWFDDYDDDFREYNGDADHDMWVDYTTDIYERGDYADTDGYEMAAWSHSRSSASGPRASSSSWSAPKPAPAPLDPIGFILKLEAELALVQSVLAPAEEKLRTKAQLKSNQGFMEMIEEKRAQAGKLESQIAEACDKRSKELKETDRRVLTFCGALILVALIILAVI